MMVDIDEHELAKMAKIGRPCLTVQDDALSFMKELGSDGSSLCGDWIERIAIWKRDYPAILPEYGQENPYRIMEELAGYLTADDLVVSDTGCPLAWAMQTLPFKGRFIHAFNQTPMGYGLPASIGCAGAHPGRVILLTGDGGLSENITEFATIRKHNLNIKTILFNNRGHAMCRATQRQWLHGVYHGTSSKDLATPNFTSVARAYEINCVNTLSELFDSPLGPAWLEISVAEDIGVEPQARFGFTLEDQEPSLPRAELARIMSDA